MVACFFPDGPSFHFKALWRSCDALRAVDVPFIRAFLSSAAGCSEPARPGCAWPLGAIVPALCTPTSKESPNRLNHRDCDLLAFDPFLLSVARRARPSLGRTTRWTPTGTTSHP